MPVKGNANYLLRRCANLLRDQKNLKKKILIDVPNLMKKKWESFNNEHTMR